MMRTTMEGQALIKSFESCALTAYWDDAGKRWTIGWGRARNVTEGQTCTQAQADEWFEEDLADLETIVGHALQCVVINANQFSALIVFCYNVGCGREGVKDGLLELKSGGPSTLLRCLLANDHSGAASEFPKWCKAGGVEMAGILRRRLAEQALFIKEV